MPAWELAVPAPTPPVPPRRHRRRAVGFSPPHARGRQVLRPEELLHRKPLLPTHRRTARRQDSFSSSPARPSLPRPTKIRAVAPRSATDLFASRRRASHSRRCALYRESCRTVARPGFPRDLQNRTAFWVQGSSSRVYRLFEGFSSGTSPLAWRTADSDCAIFARLCCRALRYFTAGRYPGVLLTNPPSAVNTIVVG